MLVTRNKAEIRVPEIILCVGNPIITCKNPIACRRYVYKKLACRLVMCNEVEVCVLEILLRARGYAQEICVEEI